MVLLSMAMAGLGLTTHAPASRKAGVAWLSDEITDRVMRVIAGCANIDR
jgi:uncharacterized membrane protein YadS